MHYDTQARGEVKHTPSGKGRQRVGPARAIVTLEGPDSKNPRVLSRGVLSTRDAIPLTQLTLDEPQSGFAATWSPRRSLR
jgi:hypothetical protein